MGIDREIGEKMKPEWICPYSSKCIDGNEDYCYEPKEVVECYLYQYYEETEQIEREGWDGE